MLFIINSISSAKFKTNFVSYLNNRLGSLMTILLCCTIVRLRQHTVSIKNCVVFKFATSFCLRQFYSLPMACWFLFNLTYSKLLKIRTNLDESHFLYINNILLNFLIIFTCTVVYICFIQNKLKLTKSNICKPCIWLCEYIWCGRILNYLLSNKYIQSDSFIVTPGNILGNIRNLKNKYLKINIKKNKNN
ncbi:hypothetical protein AGLY_013684 [Aphis glycines]|uniref:Uncharacterized protein n=1 Tax=Aphis glycines TaxID=307491 RepID=A0A6G0T7M7_APHGL|nr:hypothetical protein AGLY_013684 [Aphis glycines]